MIYFLYFITVFYLKKVSSISSTEAVLFYLINIIVYGLLTEINEKGTESSNY